MVVEQCRRGQQLPPREASSLHVTSAWALLQAAPVPRTPRRAPVPSGPAATSASCATRVSPPLMSRSAAVATHMAATDSRMAVTAGTESSWSTCGGTGGLGEIAA